MEPELLQVRLDGKFFRLGPEKFHPKGITYGPFAPNDEGDPLGSRADTVRDFALIRELGANLLRVYHVPPRWLLDLASEHDLRLLIDVPWSKHLCFLDTEALQNEARLAVRSAAELCRSHSAVFAISVVNEIPADIVRWSGATEIAAFIDELVREVKRVDPDRLCTFGNFPPTEFLRPQAIDFHCFNVYLHHLRPFENYLSRLQMIADSKPLLLGEVGVDSLREGEERKCQILGWKIEAAFRAGVAGAVVYSFTDDWFTGGRQIPDWQFGLTTATRERKPSFQVVKHYFAAAPYFRPTEQPMVSVVVATYNGARTLEACLESLARLNYRNFEVIVVDDGSTDRTAEILAAFSQFRSIAHPVNRGLSAARNSGIRAAQGEIVAFTDSDCRVDEDWLHYLVSDLLNSRFAGIGGHNLLPPDDSCVAAAVMVSPGGPAHVMLTDRLAEHIPGCNMAFYRWALIEIGLFDPLFRKAGDDVDVCWRLQQRGYRIGFSPAGFVWHYRRSTVMDYLQQQRGYGEAEALLIHRHPEYFNWFGASQWQGRIYSPGKFGVVMRRPMIYHGTFGSGFFQTLYRAEPALPLMLVSTLEYHVLVTLPLVVVSVLFPAMAPLAIGSISLSVLVCAVAAAQAEIPPDRSRFWSRPLVAILFFLQPIIRGWARYQGRLNLPRTPLKEYENLDSLSLQRRAEDTTCMLYWSDRGIDRIQFLSAVMNRLDQKNWPNKSDAGWNDFDVEIYGGRWCHLQFITASENLAGNKQMTRCRLRTRWSLFAKAVFCCLTGIALLLLGALGFAQPWFWVMAACLPLFIWRVAGSCRQLQRVTAVLLDEVAAALGLVKVTGAAAPPAATFPATPPRPEDCCVLKDSDHVPSKSL